MLTLILGLVLFLGFHSLRILAPDWRARTIAARGEGAWKGLVSVVSLIGFVLIVWGWPEARAVAPVLYEPPAALKHLNSLLMLVAFVAFASSMVPAGRIRAALKHPQLVAVKAWSVGHLLANGDLASILLFGGFLVWAVLARIAAKRRGAPVPVAGPVSNDVIAVVIGLVLYGLFVWRLHVWLFGVAPIPVG